MGKTPSWLKAIAPTLPKRSAYQTAYKPIQPNTRGNMASPTPGFPSSEAPGAIPGQSGFTGTSSPVGAIRPMNRVNRVVDEGELVLNSQDTRNVGDMAMGLVSLSRQGKLTPDVTNQIKGLLGQPQEQRMSGGTPIYTSTPNTFTWNSSDTPEEAKKREEENNALAATRTAINSGTFQGGTQAGYNALNAVRSITSYNPTTPTVNTGGYNVAANVSPVSTPIASAGIATGAATGGSANVSNLGSRYQSLGMGNLYDISTGQSPYYAALSNKLQNELAVANAAEQGAQRQSIAQRGLEGTGIAGAETAAMGTAQRSNAADLAAKTAQAQMGEMAGATTNLVGGANTIAAQEYTKNAGVLNQLLATKNFDQYGKMFKQLYGTDIDVNSLKNADNATRFSDATARLGTELMRANAVITDTGVQLALNDAWTASGHTGPMDPKFASDLFYSQKTGFSPVTRAKNLISEEDATAIFAHTGRPLSDLTFGSSHGYDAVQSALITVMQPGGGLTFGDNGSWSIDKTASAAAKFLTEEFYGGSASTGGTTAVTYTPTTVENVQTGSNGTLYHHDAEDGTYTPITTTAGGHSIKPDATSPTGFTANNKPYTVNADGTTSEYTWNEVTTDKTPTDADVNYFVGKGSTQAIEYAVNSVKNGDFKYLSLAPVKEALKKGATDISAIMVSRSSNILKQSEVPLYGQIITVDGITYRVMKENGRSNAQDDLWSYNRTVRPIDGGPDIEMSWLAK